MKIDDSEIKLEFLRKRNDVEEGHLITTYYFDIVLLETGQEVGKIDLRVGMSPELYYYGNIGYTVYRLFRGRRYAYKASCLAFQLAKHLKMKQMIVTCNPDNIASYKTCQYLQPDKIELVEVPLNHPLYKYGDYHKYVFTYDLRKWTLPNSDPK